MASMGNRKLGDAGDVAKGIVLILHDFLLVGRFSEVPMVWDTSCWIAWSKLNTDRPVPEDILTKAIRTATWTVRLAGAFFPGDEQRRGDPAAHTSSPPGLLFNETLSGMTNTPN